MPIQTRMIKPRAYFQESDNGFLQALDLKSKTLKFSAKDLNDCGQNLIRKGLTLTYSCTLQIPSKAKISKLQNLVTPAKKEIVFGGSSRVVETKVSDDARVLVLTTAFDATGIDFEVSKFNDDFFAVYNKVAHLVLSEALKTQPIRIEVLESR